MKEHQCATWTEFQDAVRERVALAEEVHAKGTPPDLLFRGQPCADWELTTTLERWAGENVTLERYYGHAFAANSEIESRTGRQWDIPDPKEYRNNYCVTEPGTIDGLLFPKPEEVYGYYVHLRHHGFPSPLLDWTRSPYIAAYFAFRDAASKKEQGGSVAVWAYQRTIGQPRCETVDGPHIRVLGRYVRTHPRHFLQQADYTVCFGKPDGQRCFLPHRRVVQEPPGLHDVVWKYVMPNSLRKEALEYLERHNITAFSLFQSEESLSETLAVHEFMLRPQPGHDG